MKEGWVRNTPPQSQIWIWIWKRGFEKVEIWSAPPLHGAGERERERESVRRQGEREGDGEERERERRAGERERRERGGAGEKERELDGQGFRPPGILCRASLQICDEAKRETASLFIVKGRGSPRVLLNGPQRSPYSLGNFYGPGTGPLQSSPVNRNSSPNSKAHIFQTNRSLPKWIHTFTQQSREAYMTR